MKKWKYSNYSKIDAEVKNAFPFKKARPDQLETISEIKHAIDKGYKYIVLEAGTGTGKSAVAATLSEIFNSSYILTVTKQLQEQYMEDFEKLGFKAVMGRSNFKCRQYTDKTCDKGKCIVEAFDCKYSLKNNPNPTKKNTCPYFYQKFLALKSKTTIANYPYMFLELNYVEDFTKRTLLVCDEAHNLESTIMNQLTLELSADDFKKYLNLNIKKSTINNLFKNNTSYWIGFVEKIKGKYLEKLTEIKDLEEIAYIKGIVNHCNHFLVNILEDSRNWIFDFDGVNNTLQFKPFRIDRYARRNLFNHADVCVFMSATILDYGLFAKWLGISLNEIYPIRRRSPFDESDNPIYYSGKYNLSYNNIKVNSPKTISLIKEILNIHKNDKGIIHTVSSQCADFILKNIDDERLIAHNIKNRAEQLEKFKKSSEPLVLISPSMGEGVDLPGSLCRFQIIYKLPRPDWQDRQVKQRVRSDLKWYDYKTCLNLLQTHGRGVRFEGDFCKTYFIDNRLKNYIKYDASSNHFLPNGFKNSLTPYLNPQQLKTKNRLTQKGDAYLKNADYEAAIRFFTKLLKHNLFKDDYYPYMGLLRAYHNASLYENELMIALRFLNSDINCSGEVYKLFTKSLKKLGEMGYSCELSV